jgi:hypothetical protein
LSSDGSSFDGGMKSAGREAFPDWVFAGFLVLYGALLFSQLNHGLASLDGHGIVRVTRELIENQRIEVSRPPGHPTTEIYLFGSVGWILKKAVGYQFDDKAYLVLQALASLAALAVFYELLRRIGAARWCALLATVCLAFSAQFFSNAVDGEEFIFALFFILLSVRLLIGPHDSPVNSRHLLLSIFCFALATGCRPEIIFAGVIYPIYCLLHSKLGWKCALATMLVEAVAVIIVWLPILISGVQAPYAARMNLRELILGGGYKLLFQCFTLPVFVLFCWLLLSTLAKARKRIRDPFPKNFLFAIAVSLPLIFFALFFRYATKPAYILVALPFLLLLALEHSKGMLVALAIFTLVGCLISVDIFRDRHLTRPFLIPGSYFQAVRGKPFYKLDYLRQVAALCASEPTVIIGDAWPWDFEYHIARGNFPAREQLQRKQGGRDIPAFFLQDNDACILLSREGVLETHLLTNWQGQGRTLKMDAALYRAFFARYDLTTSVSKTAKIGALSFTFFSIAK